MQGYNLFSYCGNSPVVRIDISGTDSIDLIDGDKDEDPRPTDGGRSTGNPTGGDIPWGGGSPYPVDSYNYSGTGGKTEIHHVVEQCQGNKSGFSNAQIQDLRNKVSLDYNLHRQISGFYSSKPDWAGGGRVRDWMAGKTFEQQTAYGWSIVNMYYGRLYG